MIQTLLLKTSQDSGGAIFLIIVSIMILFPIVNAAISNFHELRDWYFFNFKNKLPLSDREEQEVGEYLREIHYFNELSAKGKERFISRTLFIIRRIQFSSSDVFELTLKNKVLIASSIAQITFGLKHFYIHTITHIRVFQKEIMNPRTKQQFYGLMFTSGKMYLSWERFEKGIQINNDGVNLGLHETTHGLLILLKHHKLNFDEFEQMINSWYKMAEKHIISGTNKEGFFRKYASANRDEFFSVLVENFFERPEEFKRRMPLLYDEVCVYFYQDPLNIHNDFRISASQKLIEEGASISNPNTVKPLNLIKDRWHWSFTTIVLLGFFSYIANFILKNYLASSFSELFMIYLISFPVFYVLLKRPFVTSGRMSLKNYRIMSFFSLSPVIIAFVITLNLFIPASGTISQKYPILRLNVTNGLSINGGDLSFMDHSTVFSELESDDTYSIAARAVQKYPYPDSIIISYHYGIIGLKVFEKNEIIAATPNKYGTEYTQ